MKRIRGKNGMKVLIPAMGVAMMMSCSTPGKRTAIGAGTGAAGGAVLGGAFGGGKGAIIGAGVGAAAGGIIGNRMDKQARELEQVAETERTRDGILVRLKNDLLFETGSANLTPEANNQLVELGQILVKYPTDKITIAGHTDSVGESSMNLELSMQRAQAVRDVLMQHGVKQDQLITEGFGESRAVASNTTSTGRKKNRRVELHITDTEAQRAQQNK